MLWDKISPQITQMMIIMCSTQYLLIIVNKEKKSKNIKTQPQKYGNQIKETKRYLVSI